MNKVLAHRLVVDACLQLADLMLKIEVALRQLFVYLRQTEESAYVRLHLKNPSGNVVG